MLQISTKIRYATRAMLHLALNYRGKLLSLKDISKRENISEKYLGGILVSLKSAGLVESIKGKLGGYRIARDPKQITLLNIINAFESNILIDSDNPDTLNGSDTFAWIEIEELLKEKLHSYDLKKLSDAYLENQNVIEYQI